MVLAQVSRFSAETVKNWANRALSASIHALSGALQCFGALTGLIDSHERHVVGYGKQAVKNLAFRWGNTAPSNLKTEMSETYQAFNFGKYADRYLAEMQYRFDRHVDLYFILQRFLRAAACTAPWPGQAIRLAEVHRKSGGAMLKQPVNRVVLWAGQ